MDIDQLQQRFMVLEQKVVELTGQLEERDQDLETAQAANRELIDRLTRPAWRKTPSLRLMSPDRVGGFPTCRKTPAGMLAAP